MAFRLLAIARGRPVSRRSDRIRRAVAASAIALALVVAGGTAAADRAGRDPYDGYARVRVEVDPSGLYLGAGLIGNRVLDQTGGPELLDSGTGMGLYGGVRLSQRLAVELGWMSTFHQPDSIETEFGEGTDYLVLNGFTADAKIFLDPSGQGTIEPYVQGGVGLYLLDSTVLGARSVGTGFQAGGGVDFLIGPHFALGVRGLYRGIAMGPPRTGQNDTFVSALGGEANLTLRF